jgi:hydrophobic/amphiphilic exporter-1 (mainly G- bacteria), HAE1 family
VPQIPMLTPNGVMVRLDQLAHVDQGTGPTEVDRLNRQRLVTVSADVDGRPSGDVARDIQAELDRTKIPVGYQISQGGAAQNQSDAFTQLMLALGLSIVLMYMLMVALFESFLLPFVVMLGLPLSLIGAFGLLALTGNTLNIVSMIGMILLAGLVGKNAILLIDVVNSRRKQGLTRDEALLLAAPTRLRPILMTTATIVLAMLPVAAKLGEAGELRAPLAVAVIGGLVTSTLLTLVLVPAVYTLLDDAQRHLARLTGAVAHRLAFLAKYAPVMRLSADGARRGRAYRTDPEPSQPKESTLMSISESDRFIDYRVVVNHEDQYSIWPSDREYPPGWSDAEFSGPLDACLAHITEVWTDMRPRSLRLAMERSE